MTLLKNATTEAVQRTVNRMCDEVLTKVKKLTKKQIAFNRQRVNAAYGRVGHGIQVPIMQLGSIMDAGEKTIAEGADDARLDSVIADAINAVRYPNHLVP
jgi:alpha-D-ribose 1-methylphosphonate 5-phosphate C-P lyase